MNERIIQLKRLVGISPATPLASQEGQIRYVRDDGDDGVLYIARGAADDSVDWVDVADTDHEHTRAIMREVHAQRDVVASGGATISSTTGAGITGVSDTMILADGLTYDIVVIGMAMLSAGAGGTVSVAIEITGTGIVQTPTYIGVTTEGGERSVMPTARLTGIDGTGQTVTVQMLGKRVTSNGTVGSASFQGWAMPREVS